MDRSHNRNAETTSNPDQAVAMERQEVYSLAQIGLVLVRLQIRRPQQRIRGRIKPSTAYSVLTASIPHSSSPNFMALSTPPRRTTASPLTRIKSFSLVNSPCTRTVEPSPLASSRRGPWWTNLSSNIYELNGFADIGKPLKC